MEFCLLSLRHTLQHNTLLCFLLLSRCFPATAEGSIYPPREDATATELEPLYVGLIESYDPAEADPQLGAVGTVVGAEIALDHINADPRMLPGYSLHLNFINSQVCA